MKRNWLTYLVIFSLALNLGTIGTFAYLRRQDKVQIASSPEHPPLPPRSLWRELNLDSSQKQTLRGLFPEHHRKVSEIRQELAHKRQELFMLIQNDAADMAAIRPKVQEISTLQGTLEEEMVRYMLALKKNLNPDQQAAFLKLVQARLCRPAGACGPISPGFKRHRGPGGGQGARHGMGPGMSPRTNPEIGPPAGEGPR